MYRGEAEKEEGGSLRLKTEPHTGGEEKKEKTQRMQKSMEKNPRRHAGVSGPVWSLRGMAGKLKVAQPAGV